MTSTAYDTDFDVIFCMYYPCIFLHIHHVQFQKMFHIRIITVLFVVSLKYPRYISIFPMGNNHYSITNGAKQIQKYGGK